MKCKWEGQSNDNNNHISVLFSVYHSLLVHFQRWQFDKSIELWSWFFTMILYFCRIAISENGQIENDMLRIIHLYDSFVVFSDHWFIVRPWFLFDVPSTNGLSNRWTRKILFLIICFELKWERSAPPRCRLITSDKRRSPELKMREYKDGSMLDTWKVADSLEGSWWKNPHHST